MAAPTPLLYETHSHTPLCHHAVGTPEEYARYAFGRNLKGLIVTDHSPMPWAYASPFRMKLEQLDEYERMVDAAREMWRGRVDVRLGMESEYLPGIELFLEKLHAMKPFAYILGSVHPQISEYRAKFFQNDDIAYQRLYFEHLAMAAETKLFDTIAHPDLVKNCYSNCWNIQILLPAIEHALDRIARTGVAMELNTSGMNKSVREMNPGRLILEKILARSIPIVIGADAHRPESVGKDFDAALTILAEIGFTTVCLCLQRHTFTRIPIGAAIASLAPAEPVPVSGGQRT